MNLGKKNFKINSFLLSIRSEIFKKMFFDSKFKEQQTKRWEIPDTNPKTFSSFLEFLISGKVRITAQVLN